MDMTEEQLDKLRHLLDFFTDRLDEDFNPEGIRHWNFVLLCFPEEDNHSERAMLVSNTMVENALAVMKHFVERKKQLDALPGSFYRLRDDPGVQ